jgi:hypothetical protein
MAQGHNGWIQVASADELRESCLVELRPCGFCGKTERFMLLRRVAPAGGASLSAEGDFLAAGQCWAIAPGLCLNRGRPFDPRAAIGSGRLWRRADVSEHDNATARAEDAGQRVRVPVPVERP